MLCDLFLNFWPPLGLSKYNLRHTYSPTRRSPLPFGAGGGFNRAARSPPGRVSKSQRAMGRGDASMRCRRDQGEEIREKREETRGKREEGRQERRDKRDERREKRKERREKGEERRETREERREALRATPPPPRRDLPHAGCAVQECILGARQVFGHSWVFLVRSESPGGFWACSLVCKTHTWKESRKRRFLPILRFWEVPRTLAIPRLWGI